MDKIILYHLERPDIKISMTMYFDDTGQLIFDGHDIGKSVDEFMGDSDYEYGYIIKPIEVEKLYLLLGVPISNKGLLLAEIKKRFEGNYAYSKFGNFMQDNNIDFDAYQW